MPRYMSVAEIVRKLFGDDEKNYNAGCRQWDRWRLKRSFPKPLLTGHYYWPEVEAWLDREHGLSRHRSDGAKDKIYDVGPKGDFDAWRAKQQQREARKAERAKNPGPRLAPPQRPLGGGVAAGGPRLVQSGLPGSEKAVADIDHHDN